MGNNPVTTPAARIAVDRPTERTTSLTIPGISIMFVLAFARPTPLACTEAACRTKTSASRFVDKDQADARFADDATAAPPYNFLEGARFASRR
jgi:hypothetical protein